jgi:cobalt-zinc-cadmium resistance protein CzcA
VLSVTPRRDMLARYGINVAMCRMRWLDRDRRPQGGRGVRGRPALRHRRAPARSKLRTDLAALGNLPVGFQVKRGFVPLSEVADIEMSVGPNQISRENGKRRAVITANVRGRDLGSFIAELRRRSAPRSNCPTGYYVEYGGTFEQLAVGCDAAADGRAAGAAADLRAAVHAVRIDQGCGNRLLGRAAGADRRGGGAGLRGIPMSISAGVGFIALSGVAVLNGVVMLSFIKDCANAAWRSMRRSAKAR